MKLWSSEHVFSHPWKQVTEAAWRKYPNEMNPNILAIDVIDRKVSDGKILTTRIFGSQWNLPRVITALLGMPEMCYAIESSEVDMKNEIMTLKMINYTFWGILAVEEQLVYQKSKENPDKTHLEQEAKIQINGVQFSNYFEGLIVNNFAANSQKGRQALEQVMDKIQIEKIFNTVTREIEEISTEIDRTASSFHFKERIQELSDDLDKAASLLNNEFQIFSSKFQTELKNLLHTLYCELNEITDKVLSNNIKQTQSIGLSAAVIQSGITAKSGTRNS